MIPGSDSYRKPRQFTPDQMEAITRGMLLLASQRKRNGFDAQKIKWPPISELVAFKQNQAGFAALKINIVIELYRDVFRNAAAYRNLDLMQYLIENECVVNPYNILNLSPYDKYEADWNVGIAQMALSIENMEHALNASEYFRKCCNPHYGLNRKECFEIYHRIALSLGGNAFKYAIENGWVGSLDIIYTNLLTFCNHYNLVYPEFHWIIPTALRSIDSKGDLENFVAIECLDKNEPLLKPTLCTVGLKRFVNDLPFGKKSLLEKMGSSSLRSVFCMWNRALELVKLPDKGTFEQKRLLYLFHFIDIPLELKFLIACAMVPVVPDESELVISYFLDAPKLASMLTNSTAFIPGRASSDSFVIKTIAEMNGVRAISGQPH